MKFEPLGLGEVARLTPSRFGDARGYFSETFSAARMAEHDLPTGFVQDNHSFSAARFTLRGLHCQLVPHAQGKLVRVVHGAIWDVAVDALTGSPTYGRHVATELSAENGAQLWVPPGFLHGFLTLTENTEVLYKVTAPYDREAERGVAWDDPSLAIPWPLGGAPPLLSDKDRVLPDWSEARGWFT